MEKLKKKKHNTAFSTHRLQALTPSRGLFFKEVASVVLLAADYVLCKIVKPTTDEVFIIAYIPHRGLENSNSQVGPTAKRDWSTSNTLQRQYSLIYTRYMYTY